MIGKLHIIKPDGTTVIESFSGDGSAQLKALQKAVDGYVERVRVRLDGKVRNAYANEDGLSRGLKDNPFATRILAPPFDPSVNLLVGNVVVWVPETKK